MTELEPVRRLASGHMSSHLFACAHILLPRHRPPGRRDEDRRHIAKVFRRACALAAASTLLGRVLRLTALIHELDDHQARILAHRVAAPRIASEAAALQRLFGTAWKLKTRAEQAAFARMVGPRLRAYLLFELAHEGSSPPFMHALWTFGGLGAPPVLRHFAGRDIGRSCYSDRAIGLRR